MNWLIKTLSSSIGQKILMALTGLFLCLFLVIHLTGNLQLLIDDAGYKFNSYAKLMTSNPLIKVASYITYLAILFHAVKGLMLAAKNSKARKRGYKVAAGSANSTWMSRSMGVLGTIILVFIVIHMQQFWYQYKFGKEVAQQEYYVISNGEDELVMIKDSLENRFREGDTALANYIDLNTGAAQFGTKVEPVKLKDLYTVVSKTYEDPWYVLLYVVSMIAIGFHLLHGFLSAFQTMGWKHSKYDGLTKAISYFMGIIVPAGFAAIPLIMYLR